MSIESTREYFRKACFVWGLIVVANIVLMAAFASEGHLSQNRQSLFIWAIINFIPLTIYLIYVNGQKKKYNLVAKENRLILKALLPIFGFLCIASMYYSNRAASPQDTQILIFGAIAFVVIQALIFYYLPKPDKSSPIN